MMTDQAEFLTPSEASRRLGVTNETLRLWADDGHLVSITTPGGHRRYSRESVEAIADAGRLPTPEVEQS